MKSILSILLLLPVIVFAQPKIEIVNGESYDWGEVEQSTGPLKTIIKIKNTGNELLKIFSVKPGCGCTTAPLDKNELMPGEIGNLDVTLQINKDGGKLTKGITLTTNDPNKDKLDIILKAKVLIPITMFPKTLAFGNINLKKENIGKIVITNNVERDIKILQVLNSSKLYSINIKPGTILKAGKDFTIEAKIKPKTKMSGNLAETITLETDDKSVHIITVKVWGTVE